MVSLHTLVLFRYLLSRGYSKPPRLVGHVTRPVPARNPGLGLSTVRHLAGKSHMRVIMACRSMAKCNAAADTLASEGISRDLLVPWHLDLSSLKATSKFANEVVSKEPRLDVVVMNAGVGPGLFSKTEDGIEKSQSLCPIPPCNLSTVVAVQDASACFPDSR